MKVTAAARTAARMATSTSILTSIWAASLQQMILMLMPRLEFREMTKMPSTLTSQVLMRTTSMSRSLVTLMKMMSTSLLLNELRLVEYHDS